MNYLLCMETTNALTLGTLTTQGKFLGMDGNLAVFEKNIGPRVMQIKCNPALALPITQGQETARLAAEDDCRARGFFGNAEILKF